MSAKTKAFRAKKRMLWVSRDDGHCPYVEAWERKPERCVTHWDGAEDTVSFYHERGLSGARSALRLPDIAPGTTRRVEVVTAEPGFLNAVGELVKFVQNKACTIAGDLEMDAAADKVGEMM